LTPQTQFHMFLSWPEDIRCDLLEFGTLDSILFSFPYRDVLSSDSMDTLTLPARLDSLDALLAYVLERAVKAGASPELLDDIRLALEEILTNIFAYAYADQDGHVEVCFAIQADRTLSIRITDWGKPFDPLSFDVSDLERDFSARAIGGMGVHLARSIAHQMTYERNDDSNRLAILFCLEHNKQHV
jgi:serine/threonine-protein kinase RsbW